MSGTAVERRIIAIEGQIGAGKTTLGTFLCNRLGIPLYAELANPQTGVLLDRFYTEMSRWAFTAQAHFLVLRAGQNEALLRTGAGILDRSIYGDRLFADVLYQDGHMTVEEYSTYCDLFELVKSRAASPSVMVYLDCDTRTALERIRRRNRPSETHIGAEYLDRLHDRYLAWFERYDVSPKIFIPAEDESLLNDGVRGTLVERMLEAIETAR